MVAMPTPAEYVIPDSVRYLVQKERERIIAQFDCAAGDTSYKAAAEQVMAWRNQLAELEQFMSVFGISYY